MYHHHFQRCSPYGIHLVLQKQYLPRFFLGAKSVMPTVAILPSRLTHSWSLGVLGILFGKIQNWLGVKLG